MSPQEFRARCEARDQQRERDREDWFLVRLSEARTARQRWNVITARESVRQTLAEIASQPH